MFSGEQGPLRALAALGGLAFVLGVLAICGWLLGRYLDERLGTTPWLSIIGTVLGMVAGFWEIYTVVQKTEQDESKDRHK